MDPVVTKSSQFMVRPSGPTPAGELKLSVIDRLPGLYCKVKTFHVFAIGGSNNPAEVISQALSRALVSYYPLGGRLVFSGKDDGELCIDCTGDGVWLVDASVDCSLSDVNYLSHPLVAWHDKLLPDPPTDTDPDTVLILMQVTRFACGGFVIGLEFCHSVCDGLGAAQFLNCVAGYAKRPGQLRRPSVEPVWFREAIPAPTRRTVYSAPVPSAMPSYKLEQATIDISMNSIASIKKEFFETTGEKCSTFEILAASIWRNRTRAIQLHPDVDARLVFFANVRPLVKPELPEGFYGNCFFPVSVTAPVEKLTNASDTETILMIKETKGRLRQKFNEWASGEGDEDPYLPALSYPTVFLSEWSRLGFNDVDYGWGPPVQVVPLTYSDIIPVCVISSPPAPENGVRLITQCVEATHLNSFLNQMKNIA